jgi:mutator protein MutT
MSEEPGMTVTAAIIIEDGRVLISERPPGGRHAGEWEFPGGKVEPGETPEQCLARELAEELGVTVEVGKAVGRVRHSYPDLVIDLLAYEAAITMGTLEDIECSAHMWALPSELEEYDLLPPDRRLARDIFGIRE